MPHAAATVSTDQASRYLQQLCKHFAHKLPVRNDERQGEIVFSIGTCGLEADQAALHLRCESPTSEELAQLETVVADHLLRFAWRETLDVRWVEAGA